MGKKKNKLKAQVIHLAEPLYIQQLRDWALTLNTKKVKEDIEFEVKENKEFLVKEDIEFEVKENKEMMVKEDIEFEVKENKEMMVKEDIEFEVKENKEMMVKEDIEFLVKENKEMMVKEEETPSNTDTPSEEENKPNIEEIVQNTYSTSDDEHHNEQLVQTTVQNIEEKIITPKKSFFEKLIHSIKNLFK